jgi:hypothetical protein
MRSSLSSLPSCGKWAWSDLRNQPASGRIFAFPVIQVTIKGERKEEKANIGREVRDELLTATFKPLDDALACMSSHTTDLPIKQVHILSDSKIEQATGIEEVPAMATGQHIRHR